jgi:ABC-type sugar transport system substrate-binding protein
MGATTQKRGESRLSVERKFVNPKLLDRREFLGLGVAGAGLLLLGGCAETAGGGGNQGGGSAEDVKLGIAFETLQTEFWVAGMQALKDGAKERGWTFTEVIANSDPNRQLQQVNSLISQQVSGIILVPVDGETAMPMIQAANQANIPIVIFNRPPNEVDERSTTVSADDLSLTKETVQFMVEQARKEGTKRKAMILVGNLGDSNAIERRDGFEEVVAQNKDLIEVVARVPTEWDQEKALAGSTNAFRSNPDINFVFTCSDFLFPSLTSAMRDAGKYKKIGEEGHVILGGFDGDATAYRMLVDGYLDATGVQNVYFEADKSLEAIATAVNGGDPPAEIIDPGFVIHQGNLEAKEDQMWGAQVAKQG